MKQRWETGCITRCLDTAYDEVEDFGKHWGKLGIEQFEIERTFYGYYIFKLSGGLRERAYKLVIMPLINGNPGLVLQLETLEESTLTDAMDNIYLTDICQQFITEITKPKELNPSDVWVTE